MSDNDSSDFSGEEFEEDNESTLAEEEALADDVDEELRALNEESELSVEELRRRYYGNAIPEGLPSDIGDQSCSSTVPNLAASQPLKAFYVENAFESDEEDEEYVPREPEYWKKEIRIGENYQATTLPDAKEDFVEYQPTIESIPLWRPMRTHEEQKILRQFLTKANKILYEQECEASGLDEPLSQSNRPPKSIAFADDENALFALLKHNYDVEGTLKDLPFPLANGSRLNGSSGQRPMTSDDIDAFELGFREHGKNFYVIQKNELPERTIGELVNFYYVWKKTERHDMFVETNRALGIPDSNAKTIDPMDILADQQLDEVNGASYTAATVVLSAQHNITHSHHKNWLSVNQNPPSQPKQP